MSDETYGFVDPGELEGQTIVGADDDLGSVILECEDGSVYKLYDNSGIGIDVREVTDRVD